MPPWTVDASNGLGLSGWIGLRAAAGSWSRYQRRWCSGGVRRPRARSLVHIKWSVRDDVGFIELWHDGVPQTYQYCVGGVLDLGLALDEGLRQGAVHGLGQGTR